MGAEQSRGAPGTVPSSSSGSSVPPGVSTLGPNLQKRFAKGIQYNMKVVIKGDRNVGKTCLFHRLQGQRFFEEYTPTQEIQVACIQWNYKATDDVVKVEIWDIVDKGKPQKREGLKMETEETAPTLDAEFIDVYKGTSGVIMMLDITKYWTYEYVQRELPKVPQDIPVIIMASHRDLEENRSVLTEEVHHFIRELNRPAEAAEIYYMEASMRDGFGLKYLYRFFNVPFLELQRQTLLAQLKRNEEDLEAIKVELEVHGRSEEQDYERFKDILENKRKGVSTNGVCTVAAGANETAEATVEGDPGDTVSMSLRSRLSEKVLQDAPLPAKITPVSGDQKIENFVPEGALDSTFLSDTGPSPRTSPRPARARINDVEISDSEEETVNPQVTQDQESPDEGDMVVVYKIPPEESSEEEEEEPAKPVVMVDEDIPEPVPRVVATPAVSKVAAEVTARPPTPPAATLDPPLHSIDPLAPSTNVTPIRSEYDEMSDEVTGSSMVTVEVEEAAGMVEEAAGEEALALSGTGVEEALALSGATAMEAALAPSGTSLEEALVSASTEEVVISLPPNLDLDVLAPKLDLDVLENISTAPPIKERSPRSVPKKSKSPKIVKKAKKAPPPKKSLLDIEITSSEEGEEDDIFQGSDSPPSDRKVEVMAAFEEPVLPNPPPRHSSSGSLKLVHTYPEPPAPPPQAAEPPLQQYEEEPAVKKKVKKKKPKKTEEETRAQRERDELEEFFGADESPKPERKPKKKVKKKKAKPAEGIDGAGGYEQF